MESVLLGLVLLLCRTNGLQLGETHPSDRLENDVSGAIWDYIVASKKKWGGWAGCQAQLWPMSVISVVVVNIVLLSADLDALSTSAISTLQESRNVTK